MKKFFSILILSISLVSVSAQNGVPTRNTLTDPAVTIVAASMTPSTLTFVFTPNAECAYYEYYLTPTAEIDMWSMMTGMTLEQLVHLWGAPTSGVDTVLFDELVPNTSYTICALPYDADSTAYTLGTMEITTTVMGGSGDAEVSISVDNITSTTALVTFTPNDQTALFKDMIISDVMCQLWGEDSIISYLQQDFYTYYAEDSFTWTELIPNTTYRAAAIAQNADGVWGELATMPFTTLESVAIEENLSQAFNIAPVPNDGTFTITGAEISAQKLSIYSLDGKMVFSTLLEENTATISTNLPAGTYLVALEHKTPGRAAHCQKMIVY